jgi:hypothetical protein
LQLHGVLGENGQLVQHLLQDKIDAIVDAELNLFIYHEIGELLQKNLDSSTLQKIIITFPASVIELVCRSIKDILADTHPQGLLMYLIREKRETSLSFYVGFLDGLRKMLFPEIFEAFNTFLINSDWQVVEQAREKCRKRNLELALKVKSIAADIGIKPDVDVQRAFHSQIVEPLGLDIPH